MHAGVLESDLTEKKQAISVLPYAANRSGQRVPSPAYARHYRIGSRVHPDVQGVSQANSPPRGSGTILTPRSFLWGNSMPPLRQITSWLESIAEDLVQEIRFNRPDIDAFAFDPSEQAVARNPGYRADQSRENGRWERESVVLVQTGRCR